MEETKLKAWLFKRMMLETMGLRLPLLICFVRFMNWLRGSDSTWRK